MRRMIGMSRVNKVEFEKLDKMLVDIREKMEVIKMETKTNDVSQMRELANGKQMCIDDICTIEYEGEEE